MFFDIGTSVLDTLSRQPSQPHHMTWVCNQSPFQMKSEEVWRHLTLAPIGCRLSPHQSRQLLADPGHPLPSSSRFPILPWLGAVAGEAGCLPVGLYLVSPVPKVLSNLFCFGTIPSSREGGAERAVCLSPGTRVLTSSGLDLLCICACVLSRQSCLIL